jgi:hypothetical protein
MKKIKPAIRQLTPTLQGWCICGTITYVGHVILPYPLTTVNAGSYGDNLRPSPRPHGRKYVVSAAFGPTVTSCADANRLVWTKPHVSLMSLNISNHHPSSISSHIDTISQRNR